MGIRLHHLLLTAGLILAVPSFADAGKYGFADKEGGGQNDPVIQVSASIAPNTGATFSMTEEEANALYTFNATAVTFDMSATPPVIPQIANGANQFIRLRFPMEITNSIRKSLMKNKGGLAATSFLTKNITITDETGAHVPGIAVVKGKDVLGTKVGNDPSFPTWLDAKGKNRLLDENSFVYISDTGDGDIATIAAFGGQGGTPETSSINEVRVRLHEVGGVIVNGYWVLKIGDATGTPLDVGTLTIDEFIPTSPVTPTKYHGTPPNDYQVVESFSNYIVRYSEPVAPESVGFSGDQVNKYNAQPHTIPMLYNGNTNLIPNPENLQVPYYPNFVVGATPNGVLYFLVPIDVAPRNPNNLSELKIKPLLDLPGKIDITLLGLAITNNVNTTSLPGGATVASAVTSLYNAQFDVTTAAARRTFRLPAGGRAFTNIPVPPQTVFYLPITGGGVGAINLDGQGFETNDPATEKIVIFTNATEIAACPFGSFLLGCNKNVFGDPTTVNPIGLGGNPVALGGPTPYPGVNEGSTGSTANGDNPYSVYPKGFETPCRNSDGNERLADAPLVGSAGDIQIGDFLDKLFFDTLNPWFNPTLALHTSLVAGTALQANNIADPPMPNPPPLRLPVGLPPIDIVFNQQKLKKPAFVIEGEEVFTYGYALNVMLLPNTTNPLAGDTYPTFPHNGPTPQTFSPGLPYAARQQIGNFLYVTDRDQGLVQCLNSNTFSLVASIQTPDPEGLGLAPDLRHIYVSNFGDDSVSIVGTDPLSPTFHKEINRVKVGAGPRDVACQPDGEDVLICNFLGNSVSILEPKSQTIRNTVSNGVKRPWEVVLTVRYGTTGWAAGIYFGFIANQQSGDIVVYESGPSGAAGFGSDDIRWSADIAQPFAELRGMTYDPFSYPGATTYLPGGVYVTHRDKDTGQAMISRVAWTSQLPGAGAYPPVPLPSSPLNAPGILQRKFEVVGAWGGPLVPINQKLNYGGQDQTPYDVALNDFSARDFYSVIPQNAQTNGGSNPAVPAAAAGTMNSKHPHRIVQGFIVPTVTPDRMYVSFPGDNRVEVLEPNLSGQRVNSVEGLAAPGRMASYFDQ
ncbi:MAG: YncE family protein [Planctomycetes bacterium]|nr:YncE family protein [Planctomycetota bacterium]